jgi:hypothetical protein
MSSVFRAVLMWLIALTLPMQGMGAVVMPQCPPAHHTVPVAFDLFADHQSADSPMAAPVNHATHHGEAADQAAGAGHDVGATHGESGHSGHGMLKCCSATCSMAAVTAPSLGARTQLRSPAPLQPLVPLYRGVTADGLDRPPKLFLA